MFEITRYTNEHAEEWNSFVKSSKNGTFLFDRSYMDYHSDRFTDFSLMFYRKGKLYALLPANISDGTLYSHQGLTYGGLITGNDSTAADIVTLFGELNTFLRTMGIKKVVYKCIPWIYHLHPAEEDLYAIFRECDARLTVREISSVIVMDDKIKWNKRRVRGRKKAEHNGVTIERSNDLKAFWEILDNNLMNKYGVKPVHTIKEMELLKSRFPDNIILYTARKDDTMLGGTVLYVTSQTVHSQYISANAEGKRLCVLDSVFNIILNQDFNDYLYFDFGKSTERGGTVLNESLIYQKEGFGGRGVCYDTYEWEP